MQMRIVSKEYLEALKYKLIWIVILFLALLVMLQQIVLHGLAFPNQPIPESYYLSIFVLRAGLLIISLSMLYDTYKVMKLWASLRKK